MKQTKQPLYPKLSSIYNKILQLVSAVLLIIVMLNIWQATSWKNQQNLQQHFDNISHKYLQQAIAGVSVLVVKSETSHTLQQYINNLVKADFIKQVHLYDATGLLMMQGQQDDKGDVLASLSINDLYGISVQKLDRSKKYVPFIREIRETSLSENSQGNLHGYLRITIEKSHLIGSLSQDSYDREALFRLMLIIAGLVGFLLTRGLNRFSRQGYRLPKN